MDITAMLGGSGRERAATSGSLAETDDTVPDDISSLPDLDDLLEADPRPKRAGEPRGSGTAAKLRKIGESTPVKVTAKQRKEIQDALEMIQLVVGGTIQMRDPHCGGAIVDNAENAAAKAVPIICRNPSWVAWFTGTTGWLDVLGLIIALKPVVGTAWSHHVTHTIGNGEDGDSHGQHDDYSAFTAPSL